MRDKREIKFRAWDKVQGRMHFLQDADFIIEYSGASILHECNANIRRHVQWPLMQYTGEMDKNGKQVYEGDIVLVHEMVRDRERPWIAEVSWVGGGFCLVNRNCCEKCAKGEGAICALSEVPGHVDVIGNIHENPELLSSPASTP